ncbi:hypothetical protein BK816_07195 [Boudabousia tangfeifanii]|uniref:Uncharacterized protein n=1 Tax=Boudabousia tangfeifanii TaxID=1912795 RepID=A0A1D9ML69_9ACTO|nr:hypothetical protein BK816_07195 [Boudabousia tangfeifanii]
MSINLVRILFRLEILDLCSYISPVTITSLSVFRFRFKLARKFMSVSATQTGLSLYSSRQAKDKAGFQRGISRSMGLTAWCLSNTTLQSWLRAKVSKSNSLLMTPSPAGLGAEIAKVKKVGFLTAV